MEDMVMCIPLCKGQSIKIVIDIAAWSLNTYTGLLTLKMSSVHIFIKGKCDNVCSVIQSTSSWYLKWQTSEAFRSRQI